MAACLWSLVGGSLKLAFQNRKTKGTKIVGINLYINSAYQ